MPFYEDFSLTERQILPVLETAIGGPIARFALEAVEEIKPGATDPDKRLCSFRCVTTDGADRYVRVFVKRCVWQGVRESIHYNYLAAKGIPTVRLYGAVSNSLGQEIVFLEVIDTVRFDQENMAQWRSMLTLLAKLTTCEIEAEYVPELYPYFLVGQIGQGRWLMGDSPDLNESELTELLRQNGVAETECPVLLNSAREVFAQVAAQPLGLLHQDFVSGNFGWREQTSESAAFTEAVVFDLHKNGRGPRFSDVAPYLSKLGWADKTAGWLDRISPEEPGPASRRTVLTDHYLAEYARFGGLVVGYETFASETDALCGAHKIAALSTFVWLGDANGVTRVIKYLRDLAGHQSVRNR